ncbi:hypothetical protein B0H67DRAFT_569601 [Lasiosphaeris hirsuta]|uniref:Uncharacterized protein n=1 Tax=Lasiosphaeris hirsuta TaxID=260670 RepID=A0AA40AZX2_9PEZI|nr:hypothetical protein B0H67DRAFT_569601 [Lasiosphaeris hirsuta]
MGDQGLPAEAEESNSRRAKEILFLRHKIQKALLSPLDGSGIKESEIYKVTKAITRLDPGRIPREDEYRFVHRARALSALYAEILAEDTEGKETRISEALVGVREQAAVGRTVNRGPSADWWIWGGDEDAMSGSERPMTRHPGWDSGLVDGPPDRGDATKEEYEARL